MKDQERYQLVFTKKIQHAKMGVIHCNFVICFSCFFNMQLGALKFQNGLYKLVGALQVDGVSAD
jgi:hypothetical protein